MSLIFHDRERMTKKKYARNPGFFFRVSPGRVRRDLHWSYTVQPLRNGARTYSAAFAQPWALSVSASQSNAEPTRLACLGLPNFSNQNGDWPLRQRCAARIAKTN